MSNVYNRKMFRQRNARNALNQSAGIAPVQKFQVGGQVQTSVPYSTFSSPITGKTFRSRIPSGQGITSLQPFNIARRYIEGGRTVGYGDDSAISPGEYALLQASQTSNVAGDLIQDPTDTRVGGVIADVSRPFVQAGSGAVAFGRGLAEQGIKALLSSPQGASSQTPSPLDFKPKGGFYDPDKNPGGEKKADYDARVNKAIAEAQSKAAPNTFGQRMAAAKPAALDPSFLASMGINEIDPTAYSSPIGPQPATPSRGVFQGPPVPPSNIPADERMARDQQIRRAQDITAQGGMYVTDEETGAFPASLDAQEDALKNLTDSLVPGAGGEGADAGDPLVETQPTIDDAGEDDATLGTGTGTQEGSGVTGAADTKEEVDRVINSGTKEEQEKTLDSFIKEFMDKAPGYEGADSGLVLAKIGFAMAAGKSPRAIENISKALSDGADMLIKDKNKKSEFDRQLKLSALQYGLNETGKLRAQERLDDRNFLNLVDKNGKPARISMTELLANDGKIPEGLLDKDVFLAQEKAATERIKNINAQTAALRKELVLSDTAAKDIQESYGKAAKRYIDAEVGIEFTEKALLNIADDGSVTGLKGSVKDLANKLANAGGFDLGTKYQTKADFEKNVRMAFQKLIPVSLAGVQSANSISNKDVQFLADAYIDSAILEGGSFSLAMVDEDVLANKLQGVISEFRRNQATAAGDMRGIEDRLNSRILPGQGEGSAATLLSQSKKALEPFGVGQRTSLGLVDTGQKNAQGMPIFKLPSAG